MLYLPIAPHSVARYARQYPSLCQCPSQHSLPLFAGIPDFRSPGTGLYDNLQKYNLPSPQSIFDIDYFRQNPAPFYMLSKELFPGTFCPTPAHYFLCLLHAKGLLRRVFTQNIDSLEHIAGLPTEMVVAAHGNFDSAHCNAALQRLACSLLDCPFVARPHAGVVLAYPRHKEPPRSPPHPPLPLFHHRLACLAVAR